MKTVVIGGTGLIGSELVERLGADGHDAVAASPASGVDAFTGEGLAEVVAPTRFEDWLAGRRSNRQGHEAR